MVSIGTMPIIGTGDGKVSPHKIWCAQLMV
jgi:hypothetical protein